jgi:hypothetical protein
VVYGTYRAGAEKIVSCRNLAPRLVPRLRDWFYIPGDMRQTAAEQLISDAKGRFWIYQHCGRAATLRNLERES